MYKYLTNIIYKIVCTYIIWLILAYTIYIYYTNVSEHIYERFLLKYQLQLIIDQIYIVSHLNVRATCRCTYTIRINHYDIVYIICEARLI